jgi:hypothetical protein
MLLPIYNEVEYSAFVSSKEAVGEKTKLSGQALWNAGRNIVEMKGLIICFDYI